MTMNGQVRPPQKTWLDHFKVVSAFTTAILAVIAGYVFMGVLLVFMAHHLTWPGALIAFLLGFTVLLSTFTYFVTRHRPTGKWTKDGYLPDEEE